MSAEEENTRAIVERLEEKTSELINKFGPGPRIHYHTGAYQGPVDEEWTLAELQQRMVAAQEELLDRAGKIWNAKQWLSGEVLDVGCGLGGGSIFWAERFAARVTAVTNVPGHLPWIRQFAQEAGVARQVTPILCDAAKVPGAACFDAAVAIESSCYFDRAAWFRCLARVLPPRAPVFILDCFVGRPTVAGFFDERWNTRIGTLAEYEQAAGVAGFILSDLEKLNHYTAGFWPLSMDWTRRLAQSDLAHHESHIRSIDAHTQLYQAWLDEGIQHLQLTFRRK